MYAGGCYSMSTGEMSDQSDDVNNKYSKASQRLAE